MAYPTADDILARLPGGGRGLEDDEAEVELIRWKAELAYEPNNDREQALAETIVDVGTRGVMLQIQAHRDGFLQTPTADAMIKRAEEHLDRYNALHPEETGSEDSPAPGVTYVDPVAFF